MEQGQGRPGAWAGPLQSPATAAAGGRAGGRSSAFLVDKISGEFQEQQIKEDAKQQARRRRKHATRKRPTTPSDTGLSQVTRTSC